MNENDWRLELLEEIERVISLIQQHNKKYGIAPRDFEDEPPSPLLN
jgi:hypothetical protein